MRRAVEGSSSVAAMGMSAVALAAVGGLWLMGPSSSTPTMNTETGEVENLRSELADVRGDLADLREYVDRSSAIFDRPMRVEEPVARAEVDEESEDARGERSESDRGDGGDRGGGRGGRGFMGMGDDARKLRELEDPAERLALALKILEDGDPFSATEAIRTLLELDPPKGWAAVQERVLAMGDEDRRTSWMTTRMIGELGNLEGYSATSELVAMYDSESEDVRLAAARALEKQGDASLMQRELASYTAALGSSDVRERLGAIEDIGNTRSASAAPLLLPYLGDGDSETRIRALEALGRAGDDSYIKSVEALLDDPVAAVRDRAVRTIESLRTPISERSFRGDRGGFRGDRGGRGG